MRKVNRRLFVQMGGLGLASLFLHRDLVVSQDGVRPAASADGCLFIKLQGGPSHVDTFDLKVGEWTPRDFDVTDCGPFQLSRKLFPGLCRLAPHFSLVRAFRAWGLEHNQAQYALMAGRKFNPGFVAETPHVGAVLALEGALRGENGPFPPFISFNGSGEIESGFLPPRFGPFTTSPATPNVTHLYGLDRFRKRWDFLQKLDRRLRQGSAPLGPALAAYQEVYLQARDLTHLQPFEDAFSIPSAERERYGASLLGDTAIVARNLLAAARGTRFVMINHTADQGFAWDHHVNIYGEERLPRLCQELDHALSALVADLAALPARPRQADPHPSLFDRTLIVVMGEFGRTPPTRYERGGLNGSGGRDHWPVHAGLFMGGGVQGGRVIGVTDVSGASVLDYGWRKNRPIMSEDVAATIYSALGVDWTKEIRETPSGRPFKYTPSSAEFGRHEPVHELF